jgi:hypothetical protein
MIGETILKLLKANTDLTALVNEDNIFPYVAQEKTPLPFIIYTIDKIDSGYSKDGWTGDMVTFSVMTASDKYKSLQDIAKEVRAALELQSDTNTLRIIMTGFQEGYNLTEDAFMNKLTFQVQINSY